jgi:glucosyl-3-phosphoglycerate synthase
MGGGFTFAVLGHNEADRLHVAVGQALDAAGPRDRVWFVDSASTDGSGKLAADLGAEVIDAPLGKGRAINTALELCDTEYICFVDGDLESSDCNVSAALREGALATGADMVIGAYREPKRPWLMTPGLYLPLVSALFSEQLATAVDRPLSGQRAFRRDCPVGVLPPEYGVETHLNLYIPLAGATMANWELGRFDSPQRPQSTMLPIAVDLVQAVLDVAETFGALSAARRPEWERWGDDVLACFAHLTTREHPCRLDELLDVIEQRPFPTAK